jgi:FAD/FMN-containing dehydrogenase
VWNIMPIQPGLLKLQDRFRGAVLHPDAPGYDEARRVWNGLIDRRPALIARCREVPDVVAAVDFAREHRLLVSVRGGGHSVAGYAVCEGGLMIDLSPMKDIAVNPHTHTARVQPGVTWGELDLATQAYGLATPGGVVSTTGIAGLTLGGGIGWLRRKHGLSCDNLLSIEIVTADGQVRQASATENAELFWGVRGGGGNFGIVTSFEYRLHPVGPTVMVAAVMYPMESARLLFRAWRDYLADAPDEVCSDALLMTVPRHPAFPAVAHAQEIVFLQAIYVGAVDEGERRLRPLREMDAPVADLSGVLPYTTLQSGSDFLYPAHERLYYWKSLYLAGLSEESLHAVERRARARSSPQTQLILWRLGGAMSRVPTEATAFGWRDAPFMLSIDATWTDPTESERHTAWARTAWAEVQPFSTGGVYPNFLGLGEGGDDTIRAGYGVNYARLVALKNTLDPHNYFRMNQNIKPAL